MRRNICVDYNSLYLLFLILFYSLINKVADNYYTQCNKDVSNFNKKLKSIDDIIYIDNEDIGEFNVVESYNINYNLIGD